MCIQREHEELYHQYELERSEVERLADKIQKKIGHPVEVHLTRTGTRWGFYAPKNFAYAREIKSRKCLHIVSKEEWAALAGLDKSGDGGSPNGFRGEPSIWWDMRQNSCESQERVANILARVCEARHR